MLQRLFYGVPPCHEAIVLHHYLHGLLSLTVLVEAMRSAKLPLNRQTYQRQNHLNEKFKISA